MISGSRWESRRSLILSIAGSKPDWILLRKPQYEGSSDETKEEGTRKSETSDESLSQGVVDEQSTMHGFRNMVKSREDAKAEPEENTKSEDETGEGNKKTSAFTNYRPQGMKMQMKA